MFKMRANSRKFNVMLRKYILLLLTMTPKLQSDLKLV